MSSFKPPAVLLDELGIAAPNQIHIEGIAQYCGATVVYEPLHGCEARIIGVGDRAIITVRADAPRSRQRFSAAHELGHWMRDRGRIAFACDQQKLTREWDDENPERRANRYAANLLLPQRMFVERAARLQPNLESARQLASVFDTSLTATAIRLAELGPLPSVVVCTRGGERCWSTRSPIVPSQLRVRSSVGRSTVARGLAEGREGGTATVDSDEWFDAVGASDYVIEEHSTVLGGGFVLTILSWKTEEQLVALEEDDDGGDGRDDRPTFAGRRRR